MLKRRGLKILRVDGFTYTVKAHPRFAEFRLGPFIAVSDDPDAIEEDWARLRWPI